VDKLNEFPEEWLPLLGRPVREHTPEEYKAYVKGLFKLRAKKVSRVKKRYKITVRKLKSGRFTVKTRRSPPYITKAEYAEYVKTYAENELFIVLKENGVHIYSDHLEADRVAADTDTIPW
jgi:hypothetical protein